MRKNSGNPCDFCPDCVNGNQNEEPITNPDPNEEDEYCGCCSCSSAEELTVPPEEKSAADRAVIRKKELLSHLSIARTNRESASIQNLLQFVEAVVSCNSFLRRYSSEEDFCLQCVQDSVCECNLRRVANLDLNDSCSCSACEDNQSEASREPEPTELNCSDCSTTERPTSRRIPNRRSRRARNSHFANSTTSNQNRMSRENSKPSSKIETEDSDSDCSESGRNRRFDPKDSRSVRNKYCWCDYCSQKREANYQAHLNHVEEGRSNIGSNMENCRYCATPSSSREIYNMGNWEDFSPRCEECGSYVQWKIPGYEYYRFKRGLPITEEEEKPNVQSDANANNDMASSNLCDCADCLFEIECSDDSCEDCGCNKS
ncbi:uncharacterized protein TNCV_1842251 [Trichonephila clavipes]|nr:uncharacterized protein TNCV_1842251 [Trichonephila clavipes]